MTHETAPHDPRHPQHADEADYPAAPLTIQPVNTDTPIDAVSTVVAAVAGVEPIDLHPLHEAIDTDALNTLLTTPPDPDATPVAVEFQYAGYHLRVDSTDCVTFLEPSETSD